MRYNRILIYGISAIVIFIAILGMSISSGPEKKKVVVVDKRISKIDTTWAYKVKIIEDGTKTEKVHPYNFNVGDTTYIFQ